MNPYRCRILEMFRTLLKPHAPLARWLDFGGGDGWFGSSLKEAGLAQEVVPVDVQARQRTFTEVALYDGKRLPFPDRSFDLVSSIDVLHHCPSPGDSLTDALRCTNRFFLLKDHTYRGVTGKLTLCLLDEIGNRRFGIPSLFHYQRGFEWSPLIEQAGFVLRQLVHPAACHTGLLGRATNRLQFVSLWERQPS
ncbi:MAG TPA: methyltransferase domain-containing protein [Gemmataceae bacterium]